MAGDKSNDTSNFEEQVARSIDKIDPLKLRAYLNPGDDKKATNPKPSTEDYVIQEMFNEYERKRRYSASNINYASKFTCSLETIKEIEERPIEFPRQSAMSSKVYSDSKSTKVIKQSNDNQSWEFEHPIPPPPQSHKRVRFPPRDSTLDIPTNFITNTPANCSGKVTGDPNVNSLSKTLSDLSINNNNQVNDDSVVNKLSNALSELNLVPSASNKKMN